VARLLSKIAQQPVAFGIFTRFLFTYSCKYVNTRNLYLNLLIITLPRTHHFKYSICHFFCVSHLPPRHYRGTQTSNISCCWSTLLPWMISEPEEHIKFIMEGSPNYDFGIAFYDDTTQRFRDISNSEVHEVLGKIQKYWAVQAITPIPPFFVVEINTRPPKEDRPLLIADLISGVCSSRRTVVLWSPDYRRLCLWLRDHSTPRNIK